MSGSVSVYKKVKLCYTLHKTLKRGYYGKI